MKMNVGDSQLSTIDGSTDHNHNNVDDAKSKATASEEATTAKVLGSR